MKDKLENLASNILLTIIIIIAGIFELIKELYMGLFSGLEEMISYWRCYLSITMKVIKDTMSDIWR